MIIASGLKSPPRTAAGYLVAIIIFLLTLNQILSSLKGEANTVIQNLAIRNKFQMAWQLVTQRYSNVKLIAMTHVKQLFQIQHVSQNNASSLRHLINHISSHLNALQAQAHDIPLQDLIVIHFILSMLDPETNKAW